MATLSQSKTEAPLLNRAAQGLYPPGSTFKIITTLEYIRENPDTYSSYSYNCSGRFTADGNTIKCYHGMTHGSVDLKHSFSKSYLTGRLLLYNSFNVFNVKSSK